MIFISEVSLRTQTVNSLRQQAEKWSSGRKVCAETIMGTNWLNVLVEAVLKTAELNIPFSGNCWQAVVVMKWAMHEQRFGRRKMWWKRQSLQQRQQTEQIESVIIRSDVVLRTRLLIYGDNPGEVTTFYLCLWLAVS